MTLLLAMTADVCYRQSDPYVSSLIKQVTGFPLAHKFAHHVAIFKAPKMFLN